jgi:hypothetical protein
VEALKHQSNDYGDLVEKFKTKVGMNETDLNLERCPKK